MGCKCGFDDSRSAQGKATLSDANRRAPDLHNVSTYWNLPGSKALKPLLFCVRNYLLINCFTKSSKVCFDSARKTIFDLVLSVFWWCKVVAVNCLYFDTHDFTHPSIVRVHCVSESPTCWTEHPRIAPPAFGTISPCQSSLDMPRLLVRRSRLGATNENEETWVKTSARAAIWSLIVFFFTLDRGWVNCNAWWCLLSRRRWNTNNEWTHGREQSNSQSILFNLYVRALVLTKYVQTVWIKFSSS